MPNDTDTDDVVDDIVDEADVDEERARAALDHLTDMTGTMDTSGTSGAAHNSVDAVNPAFAIGKAVDLGVAQAALDEDNPDVPASLVILPDPKSPEDKPVLLAKERIDAGLDQAIKDVGVVLDPAKVPGAEDGWPEQQEGYVDPDSDEETRAEHYRKASTMEASSVVGGEPLNTDLTGTLDTSGTAGQGSIDASTVSAAAVLEKAEDGEITSFEGEDSLNAEAAEAAGDLTEGVDAPTLSEEPGGIDGSGQGSANADVEGTTDTTGTGDDGSEEEAKPPAKSAHKGDWVDYVVANYEVTQEEAEAQTKEQLIDAYGSDD